MFNRKVLRYGNIGLSVRINLPAPVLAIAALTLPEIAHAQQISTPIVFLALSPIIVLALALVLGVVTRSWAVGGFHVALVAIWVTLFAIASYWVETDIVIWTPIALLATHCVILVALITRGALLRGPGED